VSDLFDTLLKVMEELRGPKGCPWDKKQTHQSLEDCLLEEAYEVLAAIDSGDWRHLAEELGDLLLQVVFHAQIGKENSEFEMRQILSHLIEKLVRRHPHVFSDAVATNPEDAIRNWERIKAGERDPNQSILSGVPLPLPALLRAYRIGGKVSRVGFDWSDSHGVSRKVREELQELDEEIARGETGAVEEEFGDLLFSLAQLARFLKLNPEESLRKSTMKFQKRFERMETRLKKEKKDPQTCSAEEWDRLWEWSKEGASEF
jgi:tetrapyrrole methylase family protein/MazG family protein